MTLRELIDKATFIGMQLTSAEIPVIYNGVSDNITSLELSQDNDGNYYVNMIIMTPNQRKAIEILNRIKSEEHLNEDDYFFLMDFIVKDSQVTYIPYIQNPYIDTPRPLEPYYEIKTTGKE